MNFSNEKLNDKKYRDMLYYDGQIYTDEYICQKFPLKYKKEEKLKDVHKLLMFLTHTYKSATKKNGGFFFTQKTFEMAGVKCNNHVEMHRWIKGLINCGIVYCVNDFVRFNSKQNISKLYHINDIGVIKSFTDEYFSYVMPASWFKKDNVIEVLPNIRIKTKKNIPLKDCDINVATKNTWKDFSSKLLEYNDGLEKDLPKLDVVIKRIKTNNLSIEDIKSLINKSNSKQKSLLIIILNIYSIYQEELNSLKREIIRVCENKTPGYYKNVCIERSKKFDEKERFEDYVNNTDNGTFAANYRLLIDSIRSINPAAKVILCTPRKSFGFNGYLPEKWNEIHKGTYLLEFVEMIFDIAEYEGFVVADFFHECGTQENLVSLSIEECKGQTGALHPNDEGFALMAKTLYHAFMKLLYQ